MQLTMVDNEGIRNFFNGDDSYIPTEEVKYLHTHPLVRPNFLTEINAEIEVLTLRVQDIKLPPRVIDKLTQLSIKLGTSLPDITDENAKDFLIALRELLVYVKQLSENFK